MARKKLTISLSEELYAEIVERAGQRGLTITDLIRSALRLDFFVDDHKAHLMIDQEDGKTREVMLR